MKSINLEGRDEIYMGDDRIFLLTQANNFFNQVLSPLNTGYPRAALRRINVSTTTGDHRRGGEAGP
jgi:hypothetical protein